MFFLFFFPSFKEKKDLKQRWLSAAADVADVQFLFVSELKLKTGEVTVSINLTDY